MSSPANILKIEEYNEVALIWEAYKDGVKYYILKKVKDQSLAEELMHVVLMRTYNSCCSGRTLRNIRSWLFQIAHNVTIDHFKAQGRFSSDIPEIAQEDEESRDIEGAETVVKTMLDLIPEKYSTVLKMYEIQGLKQQEIADKIGLGLPATKSRIQRARVMLRDKIISCYWIENNADGKVQSLGLKNDCDI